MGKVKWEDLDKDERRTIYDLSIDRKYFKKNWLTWKDLKETSRRQYPERDPYTMQLTLQYLEGLGLVKSKLVPNDSISPKYRGTKQKAYSLTRFGRKLEEENPGTRQENRGDTKLSLVPLNLRMLRSMGRGITYAPPRRRARGPPGILEGQREERNEGLAQRITSFLFLLAGIFFIVLSETTLTGKVIGTSDSSANLQSFLALLLTIIGGVLLFRNFKK